MERSEHDKLANEKLAMAVTEFQKQMNAQIKSYPLVMGTIVSKLRLAGKKEDDFLTRNGIEIQEKGTEKTIRIPYVHHAEYVKLHNDVENAMIAIPNLSRSAVVAMVGCYDVLVGNLIRVIYFAKPEAVKNLGEKISMAELFSFASLKEAEDYIIEQQVESVLRSSHEEQLDWIANRIGIRTCKEFSHFQNFIELTERRNLFVHTDGIVSRSYIQKCNSAGMKLTVREGAKLDALPQYVYECYNILMEVGVKLSQVVWRKLNIGLEECDESLQDISFECLNDRQYALAQDILHFATEDVKNYSSDLYNWVFRVNHALSYYLADNKEKSDTIVKEKDWSALDVRYRLAEAVLLEKYDEASELMHKIGKDENFRSNYQQWPLFRKFRQSEIFKRTYEEIYETPFSYIEPQRMGWKEFLTEAKKLIDET